MLYRITLIFLFILFITIALYVLHMIGQKRKYNNVKNDDFIVSIIILIVVLFFLVCLSRDIPSALRGGEELYVNELPTVIKFSPHVTFVKTENEILKDMQGCDWNDYEKYGKYHIRYTKFNKFVLEVEKID